MILRTYELTSYFKIHMSGKKIDITHLWVYKWFFQFTQEKKENDIPHLWNYKRFLKFTYVKNKLYCTFASSQVNPYLETENKIEWLSKTQSGYG
jgi:hypothetical protein